MFSLKQILHVSQKFKINSEIQSINPLKSGHINDTYLVNTKSLEKYVLQKINTNVFRDVENLITNKYLISEHLSKSKTKYKTVRFIKTKSENLFYIDKDFNYWNLMTFIPDSITHNIANNPILVEEAGKLYGDFIINTLDFEMDKLVEILPEFHSIPLRYNQFDFALKHAKDEIIKNALKEINFIQVCRDEMHELSNLKYKNIFPVRVTHNDAKLSNILFDKHYKGLAVIDLDTVMPGIVAYDFGDSIRSICTTTKEDDTNLDGTKINIEYYKSYCKGFAESTKHVLTQNEVNSLPLGAKTITFIMGLRFLTDYLNGNVYYKIDYKTHNLDRAKNQFKLVKSIKDNYALLEQITQQEFSK